MRLYPNHDAPQPLAYGHVEDHGDSVTYVVERWALCNRCPHQFRHHAVTEDGYRCRGCKCKRRFWR